MDGKVRLGLAQVVAEIAAAKLTLKEVWEGYQIYVQEVLAGKPVPEEITLKDAIRGFIMEGESLNHRDSTTQARESFLRDFARGREEMLISRITQATCQEWFDARARHARETKIGEKNKLNAWFTWAIKHGYMREGTTLCPTPVSPIKFAKEDKKVPAILTPAEAKALLSFAAEKEPNVLVFITLGLFTGIRPQELHKITFADVRIEDKLVNVVISKTRRGRIAPIPDCAIPWLELAKAKGQWGESGDEIAPSLNTMKKIRIRLREVLPNKKWEHDVMRHSCASYRYEQCHNLGVVAKELGNSPQILEKNYLQTVTPKAMQEFYSIVPA
jgi:integrase